MYRLGPIRKRSQRGQSLIETGLMLIVIFTIIFWVFELSWIMYTYTVLADAANEGVRYSIVHSGGDAAGTQTVVQNFAKASLHNISAMTVTVEFPQGNATPPNKVRVKVSYAYIPYLPAFIGSPTMSAYAEGAMVVE